MKKFIKSTGERIRVQAGIEAVNIFIASLGTATGLFITGKARKTTSESAIVEGFAKYGTPILIASLGWLLAAASEEKSKLKYFGYGLAGGGAAGLARAIPAVDEAFAGLGDTEIPASDFYTEDQKREEIMQGFGLSALPLGNATMQIAGSTEMNLPELEGAEENPNEDLGYTGSQTEDVDLRGII